MNTGELAELAAAVSEDGRDDKALCVVDLAELRWLVRLAVGVQVHHDVKTGIRPSLEQNQQLDEGLWDIFWETDGELCD